MPPPRYKGQTLTIYFPEYSEYNKILEAARAANNTKLSLYAREMIRLGMDRPAAPSAGLQDAREELAALRKELKEKDARITQLETDLFTAKHSIFLQPIPTGRGKLSSELVEFLQDGHTWRPAEIMNRLGIDARNIDAITSLAGQLHALQDLKLVVEGNNGWRWIG